MNYLRLAIPLILGSHLSALKFPDWLNTTKALKEKIRNSYSTTAKPKSVSVSVGVRPFGDFDYPANDVVRLNRIEEIWRQYYDCLQLKRNVVNYTSRALPPYTIATFSAAVVELECNVCMSPEDAVETMEWYFVAGSYPGRPVLVEEDEYKQISAYTFTLKITNAQKLHEGMYYCKLLNDNDAPVFLHVFNAPAEPFIEVKPNNTGAGPKPLNPSRIPQTNIVLWHDWTDWTECSYCGRVGRKSKIGYCKVGLFETLSDSDKSLIGDAPMSQSERPAQSVLTEVETLLKTFLHGIPCRSFLLPGKFRRNEFVKSHPTQVLTTFCKVPCPADTWVEVLDLQTGTTQTYNNSAGEYYHAQDLPAVPIGPQRVTYYADLGKPFLIPCPNKYRENTPIDWSVGGKLWLKKNVEDVSNGRITLNNLNQIVFYRVEELDQKIYTCWQHREIVGVVRLLLNRPPTYFEEYVAMIGVYPLCMITAMIATFAYVSIKMCLNRSKARAGARPSATTAGARASVTTSTTQPTKPTRNVKLAFI